MRYREIIKRNRKQKLGRETRQLVIRVVKKERRSKYPMYHIVLARRRARSGCRYDKLGFFELIKRERRKLTLFGINKEKFSNALSMGAIIHISVYKLLLQ